VVLTGVGFGVGLADGFALADLLGVGVAAALLADDVANGVAVDEPAVVALEAATFGAALEIAALEPATLDTAGAADEASPLALASAFDGVPSGAAWWW
jgi:hypothetical protein